MHIKYVKHSTHNNTALHDTERFHDCLYFHATINERI